MARASRTSKRSLPGKDPVLRKMDLPLRKLLGMTEKQITAELSLYKAQLASAATKQGATANAAPVRLPRHLASLDVRPKKVRIRAIVRFSGNRKDLASLGIQVRSQAQDIFTITATPAQLRTLAQQPACHHLRSPRMLYPTVEEASGQGEVADVHTVRPLNPTGYTGTDVLVAVIDSALDVTHHGFRSPQGTHGSRVLYYWVQETDSANPPGDTPDQFTANAPAPNTRPNFTGLTYGRLYTQADIDTVLGQADPYGDGNNQIDKAPAAAEHGTHCLGIAAGSGHENNWNTAPTHVGAAPSATILYVCRGGLPGDVTRDGISEDGLIDALSFCLEAARFHNMPISISVSQGNNLGPHNGEDDFDLARDNLLNSFDNRAMAFAAGNDNSWQGHRRGTVAAGNGTDSFTLSHNFLTASTVYLDVWYAGPELDVRVSRGANTSGWITAGQDFQGSIGAIDIDVERDPEPGTGLRGIRLWIESVASGQNYTVELRNPHASDAVSYEAWTGSQGWWCDISGSTSNEGTLSDAGCCRSVLTVGATRKVIPPNPATGETITSYSGAGPTVDGRIKPEIVAVGGEDPTNGTQPQQNILSTSSNQTSGYVRKSGTSMATPLVAGAVALLFEEYSGLGVNLNMDTIKALLIAHANRTGLHVNAAEAGYVAEERNRYGNGRLRLLGPIDAVQPPLDVDVWVRTADDDYGLEPYPGGCFCHAPDIRVFAGSSTTETTEIHWGSTYRVVVTVRNMGDSQAVGTTVRLKYALPWASPAAWFEAEDAADQKLTQSVTVPAMGSLAVEFQWRPEQSELNAPADMHHFCLLAEVNHAADLLTYAAPTTAGGDAWSSNIKGTNNIALRNLHIQ
jgi:subtilisin family serine protease